jgi:hypothetical protein
MIIKGIWFIIAPIIIFFLYLIPYSDIYNDFINLSHDAKIIVIVVTIIMTLLGEMFLMASYNISLILVPVIQGAIYIGNFLDKIIKYILKIINNIVDFINKHLTVKI